MNGVSAVRAYTLIAMLAIVAGGWMLNEAPEVDLMEEEMDNFAEMEATPASAEAVSYTHLTLPTNREV